MTKSKVTLSEITSFSKRQAEKRSLEMTNPVIIPVYIVIDLVEEEDNVIGTITQPDLNTFFNKEVVKPNTSYTTKQYVTFKAIRVGLQSGSVDKLARGYKSLQEFMDSENVSEQALYDMKESYEQDVEQEHYKTKNYMDDIKKY
jgi:hypothetical protein